MSAIAYHHQSNGGLIRLAGKLWRRLVVAHRRSLERRALAELDPYILADIGLDRYGARLDADNPGAVGWRGVPGRRPF